MDETRTEWLPRTLTEPELALRADDLARVLGEIDRKKAAMARTAKQAKGEISKLAGEATLLAHEIRERGTQVEIEVEAIRNLEDATIDTVRCDTGEAEELADRIAAMRNVTITGTSATVGAVVDAVAQANERKRKRAKKAEAEAGAPA